MTSPLPDDDLERRRRRVVQPTFADFREALDRLRHHGEAGGSEFTYLPDRLVEITAGERDDLRTVYRFVAGGWPPAGEVPALAPRDDDELVPLVWVGQSDSPWLA